MSFILLFYILTLLLWTCIIVNLVVQLSALLAAPVSLGFVARTLGLSGLRRTNHRSLWASSHEPSASLGFVARTTGLSGLHRTNHRPLWASSHEPPNHRPFWASSHEPSASLGFVARTIGLSGLRLMADKCDQIKHITAITNTPRLV